MKENICVFPSNFANLMTEITPLFGKSFSYSGVIYEMDVFDISLNDHQSEKNIPGFYSCSWQRMLLHAHQSNNFKNSMSTAT